jgi:hypothetical protein
MNNISKNRYIKDFIFFGLLINMFFCILFKAGGAFVITILAFIPMLILEEVGFLGNKFLSEGEFFILAFVCSSITVVVLATIIGWAYGLYKNKS